MSGQAPRRSTSTRRSSTARAAARTRSWPRSSGSGWPRPTASSPSRATPRICSSARYGGRAGAPPRRAQRDRPAGAARGRRGRETASPLVLFAGRITCAEGPRATSSRRPRASPPRCPDGEFVVAGSGDRMPAMMRARGRARPRRPLPLHGLSRRPRSSTASTRAADVYVMPSVSEPFGLTALEALQHGTPVIVSRTAGVVRGRPQRPARRASGTSRTSPPRSSPSCSSRRCARRCPRAAAPRSQRLSWRDVGGALPRRLPGIGGRMRRVTP